MAICFIWGVNFGLFVMAMQDWFSSQTLRTKFGFGRYKGKMTFISCIKLVIGKVSLKACNKAIYSASAVEKAISVCSLLYQNIGRPA
jgi:hypothetical protein